VLYQVITDCVRSEDKMASLAGLPMPYNIIAGDMNAALFKQDVQRAKNTIHQKLSEICIYTQQILTSTHIGSTVSAIQQTVAKTVE